MIVIVRPHDQLELGVNESAQYPQLFQSRLNVGELEEDGTVRDPLVVQHKTDTPDDGREADVLDTRQVVQDDLGLGLGLGWGWRLGSHAATVNVGGTSRAGVPRRSTSTGLGSVRSDT